MEKKSNPTQGSSVNSRRKHSEVSTSIKVPRLYHTKSKTGCSRCRARRVKCDEHRPICGSCCRHSVPCQYTESRPKSSNPSQQSDEREGNNHSEPTSSTGTSTVLESECDETQESLHLTGAANSNSLDLPESKSRRLLELHLLQNYIQNTSATLPACHNENVQHA